MRWLLSLSSELTKTWSIELWQRCVDSFVTLLLTSNASVSLRRLKNGSLSGCSATEKCYDKIFLLCCRLSLGLMAEYSATGS